MAGVAIGLQRKLGIFDEQYRDRFFIILTLVGILLFTSRREREREKPVEMESYPSIAQKMNRVGVIPVFCLYKH